MDVHMLAGKTCLQMNIYAIYCDYFRDVSYNKLVGTIPATITAKRLLFMYVCG
uniref:Uncharacterized protein n=1 Tax=Rhizophora mucronata TaxID=61149 RepID=A0A2P2MSZ1_RHIMU